MKATVCPDCLTGDLAVVVVFDGEVCRRCGKAPTVRLTRMEIDTCIRAKRAGMGVRK